MPNVGLTEVFLVLVVVAVWIAILVAVGLAAAVVVRLLRGGPGPGPQAADPALEALRTRFARGEIDEAEYRRLRAVLLEG
jgi:putative membrane protein